MKAFRSVLAVVFLMVLCSCTFKSMWDLEGKWKQVNGTEAIEFFQKGKIKLTNENMTLEGVFDFANKDHIKIELGNLGSIVVKYKVSDKELTITNSEGKTTKYAKVTGKETSSVKKKEKTSHEQLQKEMHVPEKETREHLEKHPVKHEGAHSPEHHV